VEQENEIVDELFRKAIEPLEAEPSEAFWKKASEDIISKTAKANDKKASRWRLIAFICAGGLVALGYFTFRMQNGLQKVEQQVAVMKKIQNLNTEKIIAEQNKSATDKEVAPATLNAPQINTEKPAGINTTSRDGYSAKTPNNTYAYNNRNVKRVSSAVATHHQNPLSADANEGDINAGQANEPSRVAVQENSNQSISSSQPSSSNSQNLLQIHTQHGLGWWNDFEKYKDALTTPAAKNNSQVITPPIAEKAATASVPATANPTNTNTVKPDSTALKNADVALSKFSASAFFSPDDMVGYNFKSSSPYANTMENTIRSGEKEKFSYAAGVNAEYSLSSKVSIGVGVAYNSYSFSIAPCVVTAQMQSDGQVGYSLVTSSGVIDCPNYGTVYTGQKLNMSATSSRSYISIPVDIKYYFNKKSAFRIYVKAGLEPNIFVSEPTTMNWQNYYYKNQQGSYGVSYVDGVRDIYLSGNLGLGLEFKAGKYFSLFAEPLGVQGAITSLDKNTPVVSYPMMGNATLGITYHFK